MGSSGKKPLSEFQKRHWTCFSHFFSSSFILFCPFSFSHSLSSLLLWFLSFPFLSLLLFPHFPLFPSLPCPFSFFSSPLFSSHSLLVFSITQISDSLITKSFIFKLFICRGIKALFCKHSLRMRIQYETCIPRQFHQSCVNTTEYICSLDDKDQSSMCPFDITQKHSKNETYKVLPR